MKVHLGQLAIESPAFTHGGRMPDRHTAVGEASSPPLVWSSVPAGTQSLVLVVHDPDAPITHGFTHWVLYGIPADCDGVDAGSDGGFTQGANGMGEPGWMPPAPPPGHGRHHYYFELYALDEDPGLEPGLDRLEVMQRIDPHITEQARVVATFDTEA